MRMRVVGLLAGVLAVPIPAAAQEGETLYRNHCAMCHDRAATRAPSPEALKQVTPERIIYALDSGAMEAQGLARTPAERRALALYLSAKPFGSEPPPIDLERYGCKDNPKLTNPLSGPNWNGWSSTQSNSRFQGAAHAGLTASQVPQLKLKWAFAFPGDLMAYSQPTVAGGRVFVGSAGRRVYSLVAKTGCIHWSFLADASVRTAVTLVPIPGRSNAAAVFGDLSANLYAVDAETGKQLWKISVDKHPSARITGAPAFSRGRLYVPVASFDELTGSLPDYECCSFRGSVVALDAATGRQVWKTFTISEEPLSRGTNQKGVQQVGPSGGGIWSTPTLDVSRRILYVTTSDNYSAPSTNTSDAIMAMNVDSGKVLWTRQMTTNDAWNVACFSGDNTNCPEDAGPDHDFASPAILVDVGNGRRALVAGQKSGIVHAIDPDRQGEILWQVRVAQGGILGGIEAADATNVYVAVSDVKTNLATVDAKAGGGVLALQLSDGKQVWHAEPAPCPEDRKGCSPGHSAAVTVIPGVVFSGSLDGHLRAYSSTDGRVLWDYDTVKSYDTANGVPGRGGAFNGPGPTVVGGMVFVNSGYGFVGQMPGNVLLAFAVD